VAVANGNVELKGKVQSYRRKLLAQEIASSLPACREVFNSIEVVPMRPGSDAELAQRVRQVLEAHADLHEETITVTASGGKVTLAGAVKSEWERLIAEDVALAVLGVRTVLNLLVVDEAEQSEDSDLSRRIQDALHDSRELLGTDIRVAVSPSVIVLS